MSTTTKLSLSNSLKSNPQKDTKPGDAGLLAAGFLGTGGSALEQQQTGAGADADISRRQISQSNR